jgi:aerobic-type carbon monoxide dehydrogenase small subunit (CoxS/CutS family)
MIERTSIEFEMFIMSQRTSERRMTRLNVDRRPTDDDIPDDMPLLWTPRGVPSMTATKIGWGMGLCAAAGTIHIDAQSTPSCIALRVELIAIVREALANAFTTTCSAADSAAVSNTTGQCGRCRSHSR